MLQRESSQFVRAVSVHFAMFAPVRNCILRPYTNYYFFSLVLNYF